MGLNINGTKLLLKLAREGVKFGSVVTIGRQRLSASKRGLQRNLDEFGFKASATDIKQANKGYCEAFFKLLGADVVDSMDVSDYEMATILHDMNMPIPDVLKSKYKTVVDSGSLEHVFNFPVAIRNCMEMIQVGGQYIGITPANNFFGHGFYQFSPELFYRIFSESNGFSIKKMFFFIDDKNTSFYEVKDPLEVRERVILNNAYPSYLFIWAQKETSKEIFKITPQQSDYQHIVWKKEKIAKKVERFIPKPLRKLPRPLQKFYDALTILKNQTGTADKRFFKKID
jgi:hypothetical protein